MHELSALLIAALAVLLVVVIFQLRWGSQPPASPCCGRKSPACPLEWSEDADPIITGQLRRVREMVRGGEYGPQSLADVYRELSPSRCCLGDIGIDQGPFGLDGYGGPIVGDNDGLPPNWQLPSTPIIWHRTPKEDYLTADGPQMYTFAQRTTVPDNDELVGAEDD